MRAVSNTSPISNLASIGRLDFPFTPILLRSSSSSQPFANSGSVRPKALTLASERKAGILLIVEQEGRQLATQTGLTVNGVLGILLRAKQTGQIAAVKPELMTLKSKARVFIAPALERRILEAAKE